MREEEKRAKFWVVRRKGCLGVGGWVSGRGVSCGSKILKGDFFKKQKRKIFSFFLFLFCPFFSKTTFYFSQIIFWCCCCKFRDVLDFCQHFPQKVFVSWKKVLYPKKSFLRPKISITFAERCIPPKAFCTPEKVSHPSEDSGTEYSWEGSHCYLTSNLRLHYSLHFRVIGVARVGGSRA